MGEKTNSWFFSVLFRCSGKVDNEYSWSRATLLSALIPNTGPLVNCFPPQGINRV